MPAQAPALPAGRRRRAGPRWPTSPSSTAAGTFWTSPAQLAADHPVAGCGRVQTGRPHHRGAGCRSRGRGLCAGRGAGCRARPGPSPRSGRPRGRCWCWSSPERPRASPGCAPRATALLAEGAVPVAPCPMLGAVPSSGDDWCHFSVRLARSRAHMHAKAASVALRGRALRLSGRWPGRESRTGGARILAPPQHAEAGHHAQALHAGGGSRRATLRGATAAAYKQAQEAGLGRPDRPRNEEDAP